MSSASGPRTSPTTIRSGRMRSALRTSVRIVTSPRPSRPGGRASSRTTWRWRSRSSAASSIVTMRSSPGIAPESAFSVVVLPDPVPPLTSRAALAATHRARNSASSGSSVPRATRSRRPKPSRRKRRMVRQGPVSDSGGIDRVHARAVRQPGVAQRGGLVHPAAQRGEDPLDRVQQLRLAGEADRGALELSAPLDVHRVRAVDHHLVHRRDRTTAAPAGPGHGRAAPPARTAPPGRPPAEAPPRPPPAPAPRSPEPRRPRRTGPARSGARAAPAPGRPAPPCQEEAAEVRFRPLPG